MTPREILVEVKRRIVAEPGAYSQNEFCGTPCCIAGHIDVIVNGMEAHLSHEAVGIIGITGIDGIASGAIDDPEAWLFGECVDDEDLEVHLKDEIDQDESDFPVPYYWPFDLSGEYNAAETPEARALVGCKAIDRYMLERGI